jgi:VIT1/CCC1 family predicted Fe2+/Mn2+ transporter
MPRAPVLDPLDRLSETTFGLIMALTFTCAISVAEGGAGADTTLTARTLIAAALSCNIAWGIVDAFMYALTTVVQRGREADAARAIRAADPEAARALMRARLPENAGSSLTDAEVDRLLDRVRRRPPPPRPARLGAADLREAFSVFLIVVASTLPPVLPFLLIGDLATALRTSNAVALAMFAVIGHAMDRLMGQRPRLSVILPVAGALLVALTIALGG